MTNQIGMNFGHGELAADVDANSALTMDSYGDIGTQLLGKSSVLQRFTKGNAHLFAQGTSPSEMAELHRINPYAKIIVNTPIGEALAQGRSWKHQDPEINQSITAYENSINLWQRMAEGLKFSATHGGAVIFIRTRQTDLELPLNESGIRKGGILGLNVFRRGQISNIEIDNEAGSITQGEALFYYLNKNVNAKTRSTTANARKIHASHFIELRGEERLTPYGAISMNDYLGDSALLNCLQAINDMTLASAYQILMFAEAKSPTLKVPDLIKRLKTKEGLAELVAFTQNFHMVKGITGTNLIDSLMEFKNNAFPFTGIDAMLDQFRTTLASCAQIPKTYLFEEQAQGLANSQLGDGTKFNRRIRRFQTSKIDYPMQLFNRILVRAATGTDQIIERQWNPFIQLTRLEQSSLLINEINIINNSQIAGNLDDARAKQLTDYVLSAAGIGENS